MKKLLCSLMLVFAILFVGCVDERETQGALPPSTEKNSSSQISGDTNETEDTSRDTEEEDSSTEEDDEDIPQEDAEQDSNQDSGEENEGEDGFIWTDFL